MRRTLFWHSEFFRRRDTEPSCAHVGVRSGVGGQSGRVGVFFRGSTTLLSKAPGSGIGREVGDDSPAGDAAAAGDAIGEPSIGDPAIGEGWLSSRNPPPLKLVAGEFTVGKGGRSLMSIALASNSSSSMEAITRPLRRGRLGPRQRGAASP